MAVRVSVTRVGKVWHGEAEGWCHRAGRSLATLQRKFEEEFSMDDVVLDVAVSPEVDVLTKNARKARNKAALLALKANNAEINAAKVVAKELGPKASLRDIAVVLGVSHTQVAKLLKG